MNSRVELHNAVTTKAEADVALEKMRIAQEKFMNYSQAQTDHIFISVADAIKSKSMELAKMAVQESGIGCVEDKVYKNLYSAEHTVARFHNLKTAGIIETNDETGVYRIAEPVGPICGLAPCTNPTATTILKSLYALKSRNCIFFLPHPRTKMCSAYATKLVHDYAVDAGAPENAIMCAMPSRELSHYIMNHKDIKFILATGGSDMVKACYAAGKPTIGVGPGNSPVLVDETYDLEEAVNSIIIGKTFDWGVPCITEQSVIVPESIYQRAKELFTKRGVYFVNDQEKKQLASFFMPGADGRVNAEIVGKSPQFIAEMAGFTIPDGTVAIGVDSKVVGGTEVFSHEKMCPIMSLYKFKTFEEMVEAAKSLANYGPGHSATIYSRNMNRVQHYSTVIPAYHVNVNMPNIGSIGIRYNTNIDPTWTVGCGSRGGSMSSVNVSPRELIHVKTVGRKMPDVIPVTTPSIHKSFHETLEYLKLSGIRKNALVVVHNNEQYSIQLRELTLAGYKLNIINNLEITQENISKTIENMKEHNTDIIFGIGNGRSIDTAKLLRLCYDNPDIPLTKLSAPFFEIATRSAILPTTKNTTLVAVANIGSNGSEMTCFTSHLNYTVWSDDLQADFVSQDMRLASTSTDTRAHGFQTLIHGIEAYVSAIATERTKYLALNAIKTILNNLEFSHEKNENREEILRATGEVGLSMSHTGIGITYAMASAFSKHFNLSFNECIGIFAPHVIRFNCAPNPTRATPFSSYPYLHAKEDYATIAHSIGIHGTTEELVQSLCFALLGLQKKVGLPTCIRDLGITEESFLQDLSYLAEQSFTEQLGFTNPRRATFAEFEQLFRDAYHCGQN